MKSNYELKRFIKDEDYEKAMLSFDLSHIWKDIILYITNLKDQYAYIFDGNKFIAVLEELVDNHIDNIEYSADEYKEKLQPKTIEVLDKCSFAVIDKINDMDEEFTDKEHNKIYSNYKKFKVNQIKLMIYNESDNRPNVVNVICGMNEVPMISEI